MKISVEQEMRVVASNLMPSFVRLHRAQQVHIPH